jgi:hypothetical protein
MRLFHGRWERQTSLLAAGALTGAEREAAETHVGGCPRCQEALAAAERVLALMAADPVLQAEPPIAVGALAARVRSRLAEGAQARALRPASGSALAAAAAVVLAVVALRDGSAPRGVPKVEVLEVSEDAVRRIERSVSREQAARYLTEAQDVLAALASQPSKCDRDAATLDVDEEARRSRGLLVRQALLVETAGDDVAAAQPVLNDVERMLREVAGLEACARARDLDRVRGAITEMRLLMRIRVMTRELEG